MVVVEVVIVVVEEVVVGLVVRRDNVIHNKNIQNGGHKHCEGYVTLKEKLS